MQGFRGVVDFLVLKFGGAVGAGIPFWGYEPETFWECVFCVCSVCVLCVFCVLACEPDAEPDTEK